MALLGDSAAAQSLALFSLEPEQAPASINAAAAPLDMSVYSYASGARERAGASFDRDNFLESESESRILDELAWTCGAQVSNSATPKLQLEQSSPGDNATAQNLALFNLEPGQAPASTCAPAAGTISEVSFLRIPYDSSLTHQQNLYYNYAEFSRLCITLEGFPCSVETITLFVSGPYKRDDGIARDQTLRWVRHSSTFVVDESTDQVIFKMPTTASRKACSVENHGEKVFIDLVLEKSSQRRKLFDDSDRKKRPSELLDNTFAIDVSCSLSDGTLTWTSIEPKMRVLSRPSGRKRKSDLPEDYRRNIKAARTDFEESRAAARSRSEDL